MDSCKTCNHNGLYPKTISPRVNYLFCELEKCTIDNPDFNIEANVCADFEPFVDDDDEDDED